MFTKRKVKWEDNGDGELIVRMNSRSLVLVDYGDHDKGHYAAWFNRERIDITAGTLANAKYQAVQWARRQIRNMAKEWGVVK